MSRTLELDIEPAIDDLHSQMLNQIEDEQDIDMESRLEAFVENGIGGELESAIHDAYQQSKQDGQQGAQPPRGVRQPQQPQATHEPRQRADGGREDDTADADAAADNDSDSED